MYLGTNIASSTTRSGTPAGVARTVPILEPHGDSIGYSYWVGIHPVRGTITIIVKIAAVEDAVTIDVDVTAVGDTIAIDIGITAVRDTITINIIIQDIGHTIAIDVPILTVRDTITIDIVAEASRQAEERTLSRGKTRDVAVLTHIQIVLGGVIQTVPILIDARRHILVNITSHTTIPHRIIAVATTPT